MTQDISPSRSPMSRSRSSSFNLRLPTTPEEVHHRQSSNVAELTFDSIDNLPNSISRTESPDIEEARSPRITPSRNQSTTSLTSTATRSTTWSRRWRHRTFRNSIFTTASQLSRPPSYKQQDSRTNDHADGTIRDTSNLGGWHGIAAQFHGIYFAFWLVLLSFLGAVSVFVPGLPQAAIVLWVPVVIYLCVAVFMFHRRRANRVHNDTNEDPSDHTLPAQESMRQMRLPDSYYFVINNTKDHAHPVVTLLPPPPNYRNAAKGAQRNSMEIEELEPTGPETTEQHESQSTSTELPLASDHIHITIQSPSLGSGTPDLGSNEQFESDHHHHQQRITPHSPAVAAL
ncbi:hypothetical protein INT43_006431 [Umbelopsis isabellina]|uniref:Uncharacterized protein n=1 Tax=Mortierella isabellina TaxID=91625 RepID=A0A8H7UHN0_MORIS|nr:hypothetical protein INT43_006431 [Umbelopsis isabellina]